MSVFFTRNSGERSFSMTISSSAGATTIRVIVQLEAVAWFSTFLCRFQALSSVHIKHVESVIREQSLLSEHAWLPPVLDDVYAFT